MTPNGVMVWNTSVPGVIILFIVDKDVAVLIGLSFSFLKPAMSFNESYKIVLNNSIAVECDAYGSVKKLSKMEHIFKSLLTIITYHHPLYIYILMLIVPK
jgi:hypothetical protein